MHLSVFLKFCPIQKLITEVSQRETWKGNGCFILNGTVMVIVF